MFLTLTYLQLWVCVELHGLPHVDDSRIAFVCSVELPADEVEQSHEPSDPGQVAGGMLENPLGHVEALTSVTFMMGFVLHSSTILETSSASEDKYEKAMIAPIIPQSAPIAPTTIITTRKLHATISLALFQRSLNQKKTDIQLNDVDLLPQ
jgi:hypothetical protein